MTDSNSGGNAPIERPDIIGHGGIVSFLERSWESGRLTHGYLLTGPEGTGKGAIARWLAAAVLGNPPSLEAHPDFTLVEQGDDPKTGKRRNSIAIDQIHGLRSRMSLGAMISGGWKVAILYRADRMKPAAANALLKTLEEPHERTLLLLTAASDKAVMGTIRSRCQIIRLPRVSREEIVAGLTERNVPPDRADLLARLSAGCPGLALRLANDPAGLTERLQERNDLLAVIESGLTERWQGLEKLLPNKVSFNESQEAAERLLGQMAELLRDALYLSQNLPDRLTHSDLAERLSAWPEKFGVARIQAALAETDASRKRLGRNVSPKTALGIAAGALSGL